MKPKDKPAKKVIIRFKGKNINRSSERIKTDSQRDLHKNSLKEAKIKNPLQNSLNHLERYTETSIEDYRRTLMPKNVNKTSINEAPFRKTIVNKNKDKEKKDKEKFTLSKNNNNKSEIENQNPKGRNDSQKIKPQKSERDLKNAQNLEIDRELELNKSIGNLKKDIFDNDNEKSDSANKSINSEKDNVMIPEIKKEQIQENRNLKLTDNNDKIIQPSLKNYKKEEDTPKNEELNINIQKREENQIEIIEIKNNLLQLNNEEIKKENINNDINLNINNNIQNNIINKNDILNPQSQKKVTFNPNKENISSDKQVSKEQNKKGNKAYLNFVQNIKNSQKKKNNNKITNILKNEDPKTKLTNIIKKVNMINKVTAPSHKGVDIKNRDIRQTINNPFLSRLREDILNAKKESNAEQNNNSCKNILKDNKIKLNTNIEKFSGLILLKFEEGVMIKEIKLEGEIEKINNIFIEEKIQINNKDIEMVAKDEYDRIKKENEKIQNEFLKLKEDYDKQRDLLSNYENEKKAKEESNIITKKKKTKEEENIQIEEDNLKIKEIKDKINKYKEELKKGNNTIDTGKNERMSCRVKYNKKESFNIDQKMKELEMKKNKLKEEENKLKENNNDINAQNNIEIKKEEKINKTEVKNDINKNENTFKKINITTEKKENNNISVVNKEKTEKKDNKEKSKGYSKALDRFKKRYKNNSMEIRTKKSEKINEIAKKLENVMGKQQSADIIENNNNDSIEIIHEQNPAEAINNQPVNVKKVKKPQKPQI